ncbi:MAG: NAD(P)H-quinone oxidoreductase [Bacteroidota bacterium]
MKIKERIWMKALLTQGFGGSDQFYIGDTELPHTENSEVLIKVRAAGVNRADILQREGKYPPPKGVSTIIGLEVSGIVEETGRNCNRIKKGDRVMALLAGGGYAEYVSVSENLVIPVSENIDLTEAAGIPEVFITAFQALFEIGQLKDRERALIHAGASGVGTAAIQLCKAIGASCIATVRSKDKVEFCESQGADVVINTSTAKFDKRVMEVTQNVGADVILDPVGASYFEKNLSCASFDCRWVLIAGMGGVKVPEFNLVKMLMKRISLTGSTLRARHDAYKTELINQFIPKFLPKFNSGELKPVIDRIFDIQHVAAAHDYMEANKNRGKILLTGL